ncbi:ATP-dependent nuclease [Thalassospira alkalitolerans]|uniref:ATP-dependent nuclease n=1 Tax=Thalassospira alkalitolerans TaxID=1293890 RepID=UPI003AA83AA1
MEIDDIRVRNFRTIEIEQTLHISNNITLVGPNNSGKTNFLRAIQVFFTGYDNHFGYDRNHDLTFDAGRARTSITVSFDGDVIRDEKIYHDLDELHRLQNTERHGTRFSLNLYFTDTNTPVYGIFPNVKRPKGTLAAHYSRIHKNLVSSLLSTFRLHYVPSAKNVHQIYDELLAPVLRRKVSKVIEPYIDNIQDSLNDAAQALNEELSNAGLNNFAASFTLPKQSIEELVSGFDFMISDPQQTPIHEKGMGIQTTALLAALRWITHQEVSSGFQVIWLLEEPESYLHPELAENCNKILDNLAKDSTVLKTTHAMAFVPQNPSQVVGTRINENKRTELVHFKAFHESIASIRNSLGIRFSDFYNLSQFNVFVEGPSDRDIFEWVLSLLPEQDFPLKTLRQAQFEDFGGVSHLSGFLRATYDFIRKERACVAMFDGDDAGERVRKELQGYFGNKDIPFAANQNYVSVRSRFAVEGLFPDEWIISMHGENPQWFESFSVDATGELEPFRVKDKSKHTIQNALMAMAKDQTNFDWATRFIGVCNTLDNALSLNQKNLHTK